MGGCEIPPEARARICTMFIPVVWRDSCKPTPGTSGNICNVKPAPVGKAEVLPGGTDLALTLAAGRLGAHLKINSKGSIVLSTRCRGLWRECVWDKFVKIWTCDVFSSYLNPHPAAIILTRMLLITSSIVSAGAFLCLLLGFKYFSCCQEPLAKQHWLCLAAGLFFLVGISTSVGVIRYCVYVYSVHQYEVSLKIPGFPSFEYGYSLWMAVGGSLGAIVAAGVACYEVLFKKGPRANAVKAVAGSGCTAGMDIVRTYV